MEERAHRPPGERVIDMIESVRSSFELVNIEPASPT
jgi:hypothetical protein